MAPTQVHVSRVVPRSWGPASSWIARGSARMSTCEQNECLRICGPFFADVLDAPPGAND